MNKNLILWVGLVVLVLLLFRQCSSDAKHKAALKEKDALIEVLNDTIKYTRNRNGELTASIGVFRTARLNDFLSLQTKDKEITNLQNEVKAYKGRLKAGSSVTTASLVTDDTLDIHTPPAIVKTDTVRKDSLVYLYPTYKDSADNGISKVVATMGKDSSSFAIRVSNDLSLVVGEDKGKPFVDFNVKNSKTTVTKLRSYQVSMPQPKRWGIGPQAGYGLGQGFKTQVYIGIGFQYNLIRF